MKNNANTDVIQYNRYDYLWIISVTIIGIGYFFRTPIELPFLGFREFSAFALQIINNYLVFIGIGLGGLFLVYLKTYKESNRLGKASFCLILFKLIITIRRISADAPIFEEIAGCTIVCSIVCAMTITCIGDIKKKIIKFSLATICCAFIYQAINIYQYLANPAPVFHHGRMFGISPHPNEFGIANGLCVICGCIIALNKNTRLIVKQISLFVIIIGLLFVYLSGSRTALLTVFFGTIPIFPYLGKRIGKVLFPLIIIIFGFYHLNQIFDERGFKNGQENSNFSEDDRSFSMIDTRSELFLGMLENFYSHPILGNPETNRGTSNAFLFAASESGLIGLFSICAVFGSIIYSISTKKSHLSNSTEKAGVLGLFFGLLISSVFAGYALESVILPLYFLIGICAILGTPKMGRSSKSSAAHLPLKMIPV